MRFWVIILMIAVAGRAAGAIAPGDSTRQFLWPDKHYIKSYLTDSKDILTSCKSWNSKQWITAGSSIAITSVLFTQDQHIREFAQNHRTDFSNSVSSNFLEPFGSVEDKPYTVIGLAGLYGYGLLVKDLRAQAASMNAAKAFILAGISVQIIKFSFGRARPYSNQGSFDWFNNPLDVQNLSFMSGHTMATFAVASSLAHSYPEKKWLGILVYSIAGLTGLSRIHDDQHWASDVFAGALLGYYIGSFTGKSSRWQLGVSQVDSKPVACMIYQF